MGVVMKIYDIYVICLMAFMFIYKVMKSSLVECASP